MNSYNWFYSLFVWMSPFNQEASGAKSKPEDLQSIQDSIPYPVPWKMTFQTYYVIKTSPQQSFPWEDDS